MSEEKIKFACPKFYDLKMVCHSHGWKNLSSFNWNNEKDELNFALQVNQISTDITVSQKFNELKASIVAYNIIPMPILNEIKNSIRRSLSLDVDTTNLFEKAKSIGSEYADLVRKGAGRLLRAPTLWEDAAKTLFTTNCSWGLTKKICEAACSNKFVLPTPSGKFPFPPPKNFIHFSEKELKKRIPVGYRAAYFIELAKVFLLDSHLNGLEKDGKDFNTAYVLVNQLQGFGPYATTHLLVMAGYYNEIPIDTVVISYLKRNYGVRKPTSFINRNYNKWGPYKWWGLKLEKMLKRQNWLGD